MQEPSGERERDRHPEDSADQRSQTAEEEGVRTADVVVELELAVVDPLDDAHERADRARGKRGHGARPLDREPDRRSDADHDGDRRHAREVDDLRLAVRGVAVVRLGLRERVALLRDRGRSRMRVGFRRTVVDEAHQVRGRRHHEVQADALPHAGEHRLRADRQLVAAMQCGSDVREVPRRPVALAMETAHRGRPPERARLLGQDDSALDVRAPVGAHDLAMGRLKGGMLAVVPRLGRVGERAVADLLPPVEVRVDELGERRRMRRRSFGRRPGGVHIDHFCRRRGERLGGFGHRDFPSISRRSL